VHRLAVLDGDGQVRDAGGAGPVQLLANHSHLILVQIEQAGDLQALEQPAAQITQLLSALHRGGTRIALMAQLVQQLNARLFERAWQMLAPADLVANSCLFVMGSEGRGEQLLKTDQDNGLLLRDGYAPPADLDAICHAFSAVLQRFGYPECPGHIMLNNPEWRGSVSDFGQRATEWLLMPSADSLMRLAIFLDAHAVAGDAALLAGVRQQLRKLATDNDALIARFASVIDSFGESGGWWNRLLGRSDAFSSVHLKKAGIFPMVHGVRSLALARHVDTTSTVDRIEALVADGTLDAPLGRRCGACTC
jgi:CBS domain-containing protein